MDVRVHVAIALVQCDGLWLVSRRSPGRIFAGLWEFPGGKIEQGETPAGAAVREVREETGLVVETSGDLGVVQTDHSGRGVLLHLVGCRRVSGEPRPTGPAVSEVRWVAPAELRCLPMPPANAEILCRILGSSEQR